MDPTNLVEDRHSRLFDELSAHNLRFVREHSLGQTLPAESMAQWSSEQNQRRLVNSHETSKLDHSEHPMWTTTSIRQSEQPPTTMSIQLGAQQHQHHHNHSHLHYYAPSADVQTRNEASSQELNYYRSYQDQYYTNQHAQPIDSCRYQPNVMNTNQEPNYNAPIQELSTSNDYQTSIIYDQNQKNAVYCHHHGRYQPHNVTDDSLTPETSINYPYTNHLQHQNYGTSINAIESTHNQSRPHAAIRMDNELINNMGPPPRSDDHYGNHDGSSSTGYRGYYSRQYNNNNTSSYQYHTQDRYMQMISQSHPITVDHSQQHNDNLSSGPARECVSSAVILLAKAKKEQTPPLRKRVRDNNTKRQVTLGRSTKSSLTSSRSINPQSDAKQNSKTNQCHICNRHYARPSTLKTHLRTHTNERPYKCTVCCKTFSQAANLTAHQRVHTGERPFPCPICGRQFSQSSSVITHLRTHSGERPYRCNMCHRTFSDSSTLTKHCRIHSGEKPYQCEYCQLNFSQSGNLSRHIRLHLLNGLRNPLRVSTPASETLLQARQVVATTSSLSSSNVSIPPNFSSSSSNSSSTSTASF